ncbi:MULTISPECIES: NAD(P)/FAD-dependent oxidoreductase [unclassified Oceanispirochaeta]|uniref:dihydrolipoyl dehydrogenase family protein n=1 Tax=unclassified Oceanispirochaeta TaxID=2635722 RepID=UPI000E097957|nr:MULTISPECIES: NAD(P)/FAD-dependent oxidoreductase [unclassified Oceanispirochaeta]MBF9015076.1 NAD(P)/FAD-dependent oxidoreductase [Oceanispirochaeta sp. M2]NPD71534.1 NAD(P)/FAD-dependent oxidoreductase [Oceanispirochaeta sp. M1]RDG33105.1 NAD(P)/FAD-dependent oxidoreductase [Oceanispirochaeta sp. M1]
MDIYDVVVIGAGSGGITSAVTAAGFGKKVLLIDKNKPGGECTWSGCIPSKALIHEAKKVFTVRNEVKEYSYDSKTALDHVHAVRDKIYSHETPEALSRSGIEYLQGEASFKDSRTVLVGDREIKGKKYIISTGSSPFVPPIDGLDSVSYLTNENIFELERLPESLIILGGGAIGIEMAQAVSRLGTEVQIVEMMPVLIFREEMEFSLAIQKCLAEEGVKLHLGAKATQVTRSEDQIALRYEKDGTEQTIKADSLLVAIGRKPNMDGLELDKAGIRYNKKGIEVNSRLQTSQTKIYAIGDVAGPYQFSHMANAQGILATQNAILPFKRKINYDHVAWVTFTEPEIARAGMTEAEARESHGDSIRIYDYDFNQLDRAMTGGQTIEKMKVILNRKGKILGISILADRAGELIGEAQLLKTRGINFAKMGSVIHPYPTYSEVFSKIGKRVMVDNILNHPLVKLFRK